MLLREEAEFPLAQRLRNSGATLAEIYAFVSGLYFRGKVAYSQAFLHAPVGHAGSLVITPGRGLLQPDTHVSLDDLRAMAEVKIDLTDARYLAALEKDACSLPKDCAIVLLGSIATSKYVDPLLAACGERLLFPSEFVGRGDMSRGGLMLRRAQSGEELTYVPVNGAERHGKRPPKLEKLSRVPRES